MNIKMHKMIIALVIGLFAHSFVFAEGMSPSKGVGVIKEVKLDPLNLELAVKGKANFSSKCSACHKIEERYVGPALKGVTKRRTPEWIMNMIMQPKDMTEQDEVAKDLLGEYLVQMTFQNVNQDEVRSILEYFRWYDEKGPIADKPAANTKSKKTKKN